VEGVKDTLESIETYVVLTDGRDVPDSALPNLVAYEALLDGPDDGDPWPLLHECAAASLLHTAGTTGTHQGTRLRPRPVVLHAYGEPWPLLDECAAASLCYPSDTTGNPKGALFSHRSTVLHAYGTIQPDVFGLGRDSVVLPIVPMFHANGWGLPYAAAAVGA